MGSALKKTAHAAEQERPDVAARRLAWLESQPDLDPRRLVFIDETGASTKMAVCGAARSVANAAVPRSHMDMEDNYLHRRLRRDGLTAPMLLDGPMNGVAFLAYVEQVLVPTLVPGDQVIMDNLPAPQGLRRQTRQSRRRARHVCSCRLIRPTSIPSNKPSPNSRPCSERPPLEPSMTYGMPSPRSSKLFTPTRMRQLLR